MYNSVSSKTLIFIIDLCVNNNDTFSVVFWIFFVVHTCDHFISCVVLKFNLLGSLF